MAEDKSRTLAQHIARQMADAGVERVFGVPGGGSSLQLIDAAQDAGIPFVLSKTENGAAIMAAVTGELSDAPGLVLTGVGPGASSAVNGVAYAHLERSPLVLFCDGPASSLHQAYDQNALYRPISKMQCRLTPETGCTSFAAGLAETMTHPKGPVQFDITATDASTLCAPEEAIRDNRPAETSEPQACAKLIETSQRPVLIVGLEARGSAETSAVRRLADNLNCPVFTTYRAKGVIPDQSPNMVGHFTGATLEANCLHKADLIICAGFDPVEMIPGRWPYEAPVLEIRAAPGARLPFEPVTSLMGDIAVALDSLSKMKAPSSWQDGEISEFRDGYRKALHVSGSPHTTQSVMEQLIDLAPPSTRLTVDAGAHMVSAMALWPATEANGVLKSNGLSTMGYALPAAIGSALHDPDRPVVAVTGDGGMQMALAELATAVEHQTKITIIVLNDAALSLIDLKQQNLQMASHGVRYPATDFAAIAEGFGCTAWKVSATDDLAPALKGALEIQGPTLLDVEIDPSGYRDQLAALRG